MFHSLDIDTFMMKFPGMPAQIATRDPRIVQYVLKDNFTNYQKGSLFTSKFSEFLGRGIFNVDGEEWRWQRKIASHMFSQNNFKVSMLEVSSRSFV
jgi:cytochrome P450